MNLKGYYSSANLLTHSQSLLQMTTRETAPSPKPVLDSSQKALLKSINEEADQIIEREKISQELNIPVPELIKVQSSRNLISSLRQEASEHDLRIIPKKVKDNRQVSIEVSSAQPINEYEVFEPEVSQNKPMYLNFRNIVFEEYDERFVHRVTPEHITSLFEKLKKEEHCSKYVQHNWQNFQLHLSPGIIEGARNEAESNAIKEILINEPINHIRIFGHDEYYKYFMWLKFENNNKYFLYYRGELTAVEWQIKMMEEGIEWCYLQMLK